MTFICMGLKQHDSEVECGRLSRVASGFKVEINDLEIPKHKCKLISVFLNVLIAMEKFPKH